ncbi:MULTISPECIES: glycoside hydrolase family 2 TIM barrel-domain containing protein [Paenibacillus]|uniref:glycoside hydrolase family 2 TIM barrel-domain containing protein n=1 Tax=Paenibacillus TaxID=44249 RepID=UPI00096FB315|nr:glycoside hydrolase family 2 TIM barrel-domain containing protein [Paenibacillus peoriae]OMF70383.1 glycoside hydrolase [Paenibacillus peoriae]OMF81312.1 glycoside hydrolase [Paenibacillus peoriae]
MIRNSFNDGWTVGPSTGFFNMTPGEAPKKVTLPHDAVITQLRKKHTASGHKKGYFPDGTFEYVKKFFVSEEYKEKRVTFEFEGVYMNAMVYINGDFAGQHPYGYSNFYIKADRFLKYGEENEIKVVARSNDDSRWYTGAGIYRNTKIMVSNSVHIAVDGVKITIPDILSERASVIVATVVVNEGMNPQSTKIITEIVDADGNTVASDTAPLTAFNNESATIRQRLYIKQPKLWNVGTPYLYTCRSKVMDGDYLIDEETNTFGIRSLSLDAEDGLRINGEIIKLRGACIHHDHGVIGAVAIERAEERRIEILKEAGFNAIRSAHHPMSKPLLQVCDRLGMLVMDESFDIWTQNKCDYDYALNFPTWWEKDIESMVDKDFNHPCVIMYSIGNEIPDTGTANGAAWGRKLTEKIRSLDSTRYIINSINGMVSVMSQLQSIMQNRSATGDVNTLIADASDMMKNIQSLEVVTQSTAESFAAVDIAGYNYADNRYVTDKGLFPNRIICGTETFPKDIANNWKLVKENGHVIGDFTWTGWDYLGEVGIGKIVYDETSKGEGMFGAYPWLVAVCGDIDIIGNRRPISFYREIVFGLRNQPYIAVQRPEHYGKKPTTTPWSWSDSISSWSWDGYEGKPVKVEVYSDADEVELLVNCKSIGKAGTGEDNAFKAEFDTVYIPGEIVAVAYIDGKETGRFSMMSASNEVNLQVDVDRTWIAVDDNDLAFINISLIDEKGIIKSLADRKVSVKVEGAGMLLGFGSANPMTEENYYDTAHTTFNGKALAVIRPTTSGIICVTVETKDCIAQTVRIEATNNI